LESKPIAFLTRLELSKRNEGEHGETKGGRPVN